jgi:hypothetical protein
MAWTKRSGNGTEYQTDTLTTDSDVLAIDPLDKVSLTIKHGGTDTLALKVCTAETAATGNAVTANASITADYEESLNSPITGLQITGASAGSHSVYVLITKGYWGRN